MLDFRMRGMLLRMSGHELDAVFGSRTPRFSRDPAHRRDHLDVEQTSTSPPLPEGAPVAPSIRTFWSGMA